MQLPKTLSQRLSAVGQGVQADGWTRSLPLAVSAVLVVVLAWQLVQLGWTLMGARRSPAAVAVGPGGSLPTQASRIDVQSIVNAHLFGQSAAPDVTNPDAVAATQMNLVLVGTIAESDPERGYAIIGESSANAKVYAVGKTITGGTKLHSVYPDRVILDRGGRLEALLLPKKFSGGGSAPMAQTPSYGPPDVNLGDRLRQLASANPTAITDILRPQPVFANGQQRGYRVYPGRNRQQFTKLGLLPGDLVTAVNGTPLDDPSRSMEILQAMNSASDVTVTIERNGQSTQININNAQVAADAAAAAAAPPATVPVSEAPPPPGQDPSE